METPVPHPEDFAHVRIIMGMVLGLSLARLVNGLTRFVQHPGSIQVYSVHIGWVIFLLISIMHFWWYEFHLSFVRTWTFPIYFFLIAYAMIFAALTALLFPDQMMEYKGFEDYFESRKRWFFGLLSITFLVDFVDTLVKGEAYFRSLGSEYPVRQVVFFVLSIVAMFVKSKRHQLWLVVFAILYQVSWILRTYDFLQ
ncbi:hypothetical protein [Agrobacterium tumefaciens]|uniref:hypothetical protein n=1 Tax=Agrobacterium tumefaciens TaxID=358 RepID=UPI000EF1986C|nr:hypothetical protein [Agrobacterium tumefaciens]AYM09014.1 membrane protein [Agrobacterium tumefaciens]NSZ33321.1 hypothetical protein [Agrobacterium tumefaciens]QLG25708.1 hypothetical protein EML4_25705 [Agrobacterium tumefaciens]UXS89314.1 hypothetical protein FY144_23995 [Agrobacterium tumefaciens]